MQYNNTIYLEHATKRIMAALQAVPGKLYLGALPIKDAAAVPAPSFVIQWRIRKAIERKLSAME